MKHLRVYLFTALALFGGLTSVFAGPAEELQAAIESSLDVVFEPEYAGLSESERQTKIRSILEERYDLQVLIRRAMGRNWDLLDAQEQVQVVELIKQLVLKAFIKNMSGTERPKLVFEPTIEITDKRIEVPTTVTWKGNYVSVLYRLGRMSSGWEIYDIVGENISVVSNYRQQLDDHFRKGTGAELIEKLEKLLQSDDIGNEIKI